MFHQKKFSIIMEQIKSLWQISLRPKPFETSSKTTMFV
ncbi:hypothetical protein AsAng_0046740 [Aureispira anguillae]|uniref:Uncharacterized protein n=1 Tax=Aureispira anguillae TaxID=2864201 RepID=A0A916DV22_9BACT|nr:hypothetical protein AsAng_0046740 [Aureispira anguillae]